MLEFLFIVAIFLNGIWLGFYLGRVTRGKEVLTTIKKTIKGKNYGAVIPPKTAEEIQKEKNKEFYDKI